MQTAVEKRQSRLEEERERPSVPSGGYLSAGPSAQPSLGRYPLALRVCALIVLLLIAATLGGASFGYLYAVRSDEQQEIERRQALLAAVAQYQVSFGDSSVFDSRFIDLLARSSSLKDLRFESEPAANSRTLQPVTDRNGRIIGWFSWSSERPMTQMMRRFWPHVAGLTVGFLLLAGVVLHQIRRSARELAESDAELHRVAHEDLLTGLPNDRHMLELLDAALAGRKLEQTVIFAFLDIESFNDINGALGREGVDVVLKELSERLKAAMPEGAVVGHFGGDEFGVIMVSEGSEGALRELHAAVRAVSSPIWTDQMILVRVRAGIAQVPRDGQTRDELIRRADLALLASKRKGQGLVTRFEPELEREVADRHFLRRELRRAMTEQSLQVHYQPIVAAAGSQIVGVEALLRWSHPARGAIPPTEFIPVAESSGLMEELGTFVLRRALVDARRWPHLFVAINLSPIQVRDRAMIHNVQALLAESGVEASRVVLEITEGVLIESPQDVRARLQELRAIGVRVALDDFGSGYSSLGYLQQFPIDKLKIDKRFVDPLGRYPNSGAIVQAIVALGRALDLSVLAEGVETEEQRVLLRLAGCDEMQGFLFAKAVPRDAIDRLLRVGSAEHTLRATGR